MQAFVELQKKIITEQDVETFKTCKIKDDILLFIGKLAHSVQGKKISQTKPNKKFDLIQQFLQNLETKLKDVPPAQQAQRYGNKAFRDWLEQIIPLIDDYLGKQLPQNLQGASIELKGYLQDSFGNKQRIDYGTGHEFNFLLFLLCLQRLGIIEEADYEYVVRFAFYKYIDLVRKVQFQYFLEPAGSHGVWGLDDYQFLPFLFGASELIGSEITTKDIIKENQVKRHMVEYQFFQCIDFIDKVKKGPFNEHSPILFSLTNVAQWEKVLQGLMKMFQAEVLYKHPVIKHTLFGSIIDFK